MGNKLNTLTSKRKNKINKEIFFKKNEENNVNEENYMGKKTHEQGK